MEKRFTNNFLLFFIDLRVSKGICFVVLGIQNKNVGNKTWWKVLFFHDIINLYAENVTQIHAKYCFNFHKKKTHTHTEIKKFNGKIKKNWSTNFINRSSTKTETDSHQRYIPTIGTNWAGCCMLQISKHKIEPEKKSYAK